MSGRCLLPSSCSRRRTVCPEMLGHLPRALQLGFHLRSDSRTCPRPWCLMMKHLRRLPTQAGLYTCLNYRYQDKPRSLQKNATVHWYLGKGSGDRAGPGSISSAWFCIKLSQQEAGPMGLQGVFVSWGRRQLQVFTASTWNFLELEYLALI